MIPWRQRRASLTATDGVGLKQERARESDSIIPSASLSTRIADFDESCKLRMKRVQ